MNGDKRLFRYALEPQLQRLRWRLDEEFSAVARCVEAQERLRVQGAAIDDQLTAAIQETTRQQAVRIDPLRACHGVAFLAALHQRKVCVENDWRRSDATLTEAREALGRTQREIEKLESDRLDLLAEHLREMDRRQVREADQDWIARDAWRTGIRAGLGECS